MDTDMLTAFLVIGNLAMGILSMGASLLASTDEARASYMRWAILFYVIAFGLK